MNKPLNFSVIGGDRRQIYTASLLAADGHNVSLFGYGKHNDTDANIHSAASISDCIADSEIVLLPMPYNLPDKDIINAPLSTEPISLQSLIPALNRGCTILAGKTDSLLENLCRDLNIRLKDYSNREELAVLNAIPTAEGAIALALCNTPYTLHDSHCLVIGYGRIGKILSTDLKALGARVTATARNHRDLAWIKAYGCDPMPTYRISDTIGHFDIIFNTVPHKILGFTELSATKKDVLIIDLASAPGGVDFNIARKLGRNTLHALSLPGKTSPYTAGRIIKDTIINILEEMNL